MNTHDNKHNDSHCKTTDKKTLVVIGGGFAGLNLVKRLNKRQWDVVVIDRFNFHSFPPLFYQVASAGLDPGSISFPLRREMRQRRLRGCTFHLPGGDPAALTASLHRLAGFHTDYRVYPGHGESTTLAGEKLVEISGIEPLTS